MHPPPGASSARSTSTMSSMSSRWYTMSVPNTTSKGAARASLTPLGSLAAAAQSSCTPSQVQPWGRDSLFSATLPWMNAQRRLGGELAHHAAREC
jgi:hypothetical protein